MGLERLNHRYHGHRIMTRKQTYTERESARSRRMRREQDSEQEERRHDAAMQRRGRHGEDSPQPKRRVPVGKIAIAAVLVVVAIAGVMLFASAASVQVTVNGAPVAIRGAKTLQVAIKESGLPINPGDLISLKGNVLQKGKGKPVTAVVNGKEVDDLDTPLHNGDEIQISDGGDIVEDYDEMIEVLQHNAETRGIGVFREFENVGMDGALSIRTGVLSGETISKHLFYPIDLVFTKHNPNVGEKKVLALTFNDGPNATYTPEILDVLRENGARATFFVLGNSIQELGNEWVLQLAAEDGHQICSQTYDNAIGAGGNINNLDPAAQIAEIEDGRAAITEALGTEASRVVRVPGGSMDSATLKNLRPYIDVEVGWNVDTRDDEGIEAQYIADALLAATPGDVFLLHDGGGDRSATVEALRIALPQLKKAGWEFVTIDDLMKYPALTQ